MKIHIQIPIHREKSNKKCLIITTNEEYLAQWRLIQKIRSHKSEQQKENRYSQIRRNIRKYDVNKLEPVKANEMMILF